MMTNPSSLGTRNVSRLLLKISLQSRCESESEEEKMGLFFSARNEAPMPIRMPIPRHSNMPEVSRKVLGGIGGGCGDSDGGADALHVFSDGLSCSSGSGSAATVKKLGVYPPRGIVSRSSSCRPSSAKYSS